MKLIQQLIENQAVLIQSQFELSKAHNSLCVEVISSTTAVIPTSSIKAEELIEQYEIPPLVVYDLNALSLHEIAACVVLLEGEPFNEVAIQDMTTAAIAAVKAKEVPPEIDRIYTTIVGLQHIDKLTIEQKYTLCATLLHDWDNRKATKKVPNPHKDYAQHFINSALGLTEAKATEMDVPDYIALRKAVTHSIGKLVEDGRRKEAVEILKKYNAKKLPDIADDNLVEVLELTERVLAEGA